MGAITSGIASGAVQSFTGNIESAILVIHDGREAGAKAGVKGFEDKIKIAAALNNERIAATKAALSEGTTPVYPNQKDKIFQIHFNPSQLTLNATSMPTSAQDIMTRDSFVQAPADPTLTLTTVLYFDDMDTYDSFQSEKFTKGISASGITNARKMLADVKDKGKTHSVRPKVEALVAALRDPLTRTISFRWNDFSFIGQLTTVRAKYTMFSTSGCPVRAEVLLRMQHEIDPVMMKRWYEDFEKAFGRTSSTAQKAMQNTKNLINLNL